MSRREFTDGGLNAEELEEARRYAEERGWSLTAAGVEALAWRLPALVARRRRLRAWFKVVPEDVRRRVIRAGLEAAGKAGWGRTTRQGLGEPPDLEALPDWMQPYIVRAVEADRDARLVRFAVQAPHPFTLDAAAQAIGFPLPLPRKAQNELAALLSRIGWAKRRAVVWEGRR